MQNMCEVISRLSMIHSSFMRPQWAKKTHQIPKMTYSRIKAFVRRFEIL